MDRKIFMLGNIYLRMSEMLITLPLKKRKEKKKKA